VAHPALIGLALEGEQLSDEVERHRCAGLTGFECFEETATRMVPTADLDGGGSRASEEGVIPSVPIHEQPPLAPVEDRLGTLGLPVRRVDEGGVLLVADVEPDVAALGTVGVVAIEHAQAGVVGLQDVGAQGLFEDRLGDGGQRVRGLRHPIGEGRDAQLDAIALVGLRLPMERLMLLVLGHQHLGEQAGAGQPAVDDLVGRWSDGDFRLARAARQLLARMDDDLEARWHEFEHLAALVADLGLCRAAQSAGALLLRHGQRHRFPGQRGGQRLATVPLARLGLGRGKHGALGSGGLTGGRRLYLGRGCVGRSRRRPRSTCELLKEERQLLRAELLRLPAELLSKGLP